MTIEPSILYTTEAILAHLTYKIGMTKFPEYPHWDGRRTLCHDGGLEMAEVKRWGSGPITPSRYLPSSLDGHTRMESTANHIVPALLAAIKVHKEEGIALERMRIGTYGQDRPADFAKRLNVTTALDQLIKLLVNNYDEVLLECLDAHWRKWSDWAYASDEAIKARIPGFVDHIFEEWVKDLRWRQNETPELEAERELLTSWGSW